MENKTSYKMFVKEMVIKHLKLRVVYKNVSYTYKKGTVCLPFAPYVIDKILYIDSEISLKFHKSKQLRSFLI